MIIPIKLPPTSHAGGQSPATSDDECVPEEWSLIELNGTLNCTGGANHATTGEGLGGMPLGQLSFPAPDKVWKEDGVRVWEMVGPWANKNVPAGCWAAHSLTSPSESHSRSW